MTCSRKKTRKRIQKDKYMTLEIKRSAKETTVKLVGRLDSFTSPALEKTIDKIANDTANVVLELSGLEQVSEIGVKALLNVHEKMSSKGSLRITGVCDGVMETLRSCGCVEVLAIS